MSMYVGIRVMQTTCNGTELGDTGMHAPWKSAVLMGPGHTQVTLIFPPKPRWWSSELRLSQKPRAANLLAE